jgi:hypothetical protein
MTFRLGNTPVSALRLGNSTVSRLYRGTSLVFDAAPAPSFDADALAYITAVEAADGQALESGVKTAINDFVVGCKSDGIWAAINQSYILAGARTLNGALVPLKGPAPTNFNFVSADYNRETGLKGNGTTKYLSTNRLMNAEAQDNRHIALMFTSPISTGWMFGDASRIWASSAFVRFGETTNRPISPALVAGFVGFRKSTGSEVDVTDATGTRTFQAGTNNTANEILIFARNTTDTSGSYAERISFWSTGTAAAMPAIQGRVEALMTAINGAI